MNNFIITYKELSEESQVRLKARDKYNYEIIPVPRQISKTCGIAYRVTDDSINGIINIIIDLIKTEKVKKENIHLYKEEDKVYKEIGL